MVNVYDKLKLFGIEFLIVGVLVVVYVMSV